MNRANLLLICDGTEIPAWIKQENPNANIRLPKQSHELEGYVDACIVIDSMSRLCTAPWVELTLTRLRGFGRNVIIIM